MPKAKGKKQRPKVVPERANVPVARTAWSTAPAQIKTWRRCHRTMAEAASRYEPAGEGEWRLALMGDSITESWLGSAFCHPIGRARNVPKALADTLGQRWTRPLVLGIAADHTQHLLFRLKDGELSPAMATDPRMVSVVLIGTNNLGRGHSAAETAAGIEAVASHLLTATRGRVLVNAILPRGDAAKRVHADTLVGVDASGRARRSFAPLIGRTNAAFNASAGRLAARYPGRLQLIDCGEPFRLGDGVHVELMPDTLHPNAAGSRLWAGCLSNALTAWLSG